jgi:hypothetical protein
MISTFFFYVDVISLIGKTSYLMVYKSTSNIEIQPIGIHLNITKNILVVSILPRRIIYSRQPLTPSFIIPIKF